MNFDPPEKCQSLSAAELNPDVLKFLSQRRSTLVRSISDPGPDQETLDLILRLAARSPDHRKLTPWRFLVFQGDARADFGDHLAGLFQEDCPDAPSERAEFERARFMRTPLVIGVVSSPKDCPRGTPKWEQELSAGAVCMNMLLAARASGFAAQWLSEWYAFNKRVNEILGLAEHERMAGFIYIGTATDNPVERNRPEMTNLTHYWNKETTNMNTT